MGQSCDTFRTKRIICFGDSVTQGTPHVSLADGFPSLLERRLTEKYSPDTSVCMHNSGVGGENSAEGLARIETDVLDQRPDVVTVEFGLNDIRYEPEKHVTEKDFANNLRQIYERIHEAGAKVVFMTPNPIINEYHVYSMGTDYYDDWGGCNGACAAYAEIVREVAAEAETPLCDIYGDFVKEAIKLEFLGETFEYEGLSVLSRYVSSRDGVHPTVAGQEFIATSLYQVIVSRRMLLTEVHG